MDHFNSIWPQFKPTSLQHTAFPSIIITEEFKRRQRCEALACFQLTGAKAAGPAAWSQEEVRLLQPEAAKPQEVELGHR